jgi:four helix bundle protein
MKITKLEDMKVWNESVKLSVNVYKTIAKSNYLKKDSGLRDQIQRSAVSIPSNIAEGFERETNAEFLRFLFYAKSSCAELKTQLLIAKEINSLDEDVYKDLKASSDYISVMLHKLIQYLKNEKK